MRSFSTPICPSSTAVSLLRRLRAEDDATLTLTACDDRGKRVKLPDAKADDIISRPFAI
jgi:DNA-binding response OmpR family regulator